MRFSAVASAVLASPVLVLSGCAADTDHNEADVTFAQQMVPHHQQAIEMTRVVAKAEASPGVEKLAARIEKAQGPEISTMNGWLDDWDATASSSHDDMDHGSGSDDGMVSNEQMADLRSSSGATFDRLWLTLMIEHHEGATTMAEREMRDGENSEAVHLAHDIAKTQAVETDRMKEMLDD